MRWPDGACAQPGTGADASIPTTASPCSNINARAPAPTGSSRPTSAQGLGFLFSLLLPLNAFSRDDRTWSIAPRQQSPRSTSHPDQPAPSPRASRRRRRALAAEAWHTVSRARRLRPRSACSGSRAGRRTCAGCSAYRRGRLARNPPARRGLLWWAATLRPTAADCDGGSARAWPRAAFVSNACSGTG